MSLYTTHLWHKRARPDPTAENFNVQLGCHMEEIAEMLVTLTGETHLAQEALDEARAAVKALSRLLKTHQVAARIKDREGFLDSLADQIVTAVGVGYCAGMDVPSALSRVNESNWSKFDDEGQPIFNAAGKIAKGPNYKEPDLSGLY